MRAPTRTQLALKRGRVLVGNVNCMYTLSAVCRDAYRLVPRLSGVTLSWDAHRGRRGCSTPTTVNAECGVTGCVVIHLRVMHVRRGESASAKASLGIMAAVPMHACMMQNSPTGLRLTGRRHEEHRSNTRTRTPRAMMAPSERVVM